jgi:L-ribulose-5-phosphate 4-epimerase
MHRGDRRERRAESVSETHKDVSASSARSAVNLARRVWRANVALGRSGLVFGTFGNVSGIDRARGVVAIKPSGVGYEHLRPQQIVLVSLETGEAVSGRLRPSSDLPTHLELYRAFPSIGGVVHAHGLHATAWAQAAMAIPPLGTTHADYFAGPVPCTRPLRPAEIRRDYERHTGRVIVETFAAPLDPAALPGVLVAHHGPFAWGATPDEAVHHALVLEYLASLATLTRCLQPSIKPIAPALLAKHFSRKHGPDAYYGQARPQRRPGEGRSRHCLGRPPP